MSPVSTTARACLALFAVPLALHAQPRITVTLPAARATTAQDGRLLFLLSADSSAEPRFQIQFGAGTQLVFGSDVDGWAPGTTRSVPGAAFGFPIRSMKDIPAGTYRVQAFLNRYDTFTLGDGRRLKLAPDRGEGQQWASKPGNLYSTPRTIRWDPSRPASIALSLENEIAALPGPATRETKYVKYVKVRSERLSKFWGRDMFLAAWVLLPWGFDEHPSSRYPLVINHGHFPMSLTGWRETPPDPDLKPDFSTRFQLAGYNRIQQQLGYEFFQAWTGTGFPRALMIEIQHPTPFYDDSYAVNSPNSGPYGDAIQYELLPEIEKRYRGLGAGWARFVFGGSTGGWESMAVQMFYPEEYNGAWVACPDPIDFRHYTTVNIYSDTNAYVMTSRFKRTPRPAHRNYLGHVDATVQDMNQFEYALGSHGRSGDQFDVWESTFSPVGPDGYPARIWNRETGTIDPNVAAYWRDHWDLSFILKRDWVTLGPKLKGKLRIYVGDMDNYYLNNAVYEVESFLKTASPAADAVVDYGDRDEHCWNGDHTRSNAYSRLRYPQMVLPWAVERMLTTAPAGADLRSWRY